MNAPFVSVRDCIQQLLRDLNDFREFIWCYIGFGERKMWRPNDAKLPVMTGNTPSNRLPMTDKRSLPRIISVPLSNYKSRRQILAENPVSGHYHQTFGDGLCQKQTVERITMQQG